MSDGVLLCLTHGVRQGFINVCVCGLQLIDRLLLIFMPVKYQPDYTYLRHVPLWRVHIFTFLQVLCLAALWAVKSVKSISIVFPLLVSRSRRARRLLASFIVQELCESRGGRPGLSVLTAFWFRHWSQLVPNMSTDIRGH